MRFGHGEPHRITGLHDIVTDETLRQVAHVLDPVDQPGHGEAMRRIPGHHLALHVDAAIRHAQDECAARARLELDRSPEEVLLGELDCVSASRPSGVDAM
jgi:hypothetical protein